MAKTLTFREDEYDLDGLLSVSEMTMADLVFMIEEEESGLYYIDRIEIQKYDSTFSKFMMRVKNYLEREETSALFVLFARKVGEAIQVFDGKNQRLGEMPTGDIELEQDTFYGIMIQYRDESYILQQAVYTRENYEGDARGEIIEDAGELTELMKKFVLEFN